MKLTLQECLYIHDGLLAMSRRDYDEKKLEKITALMKKFENEDGTVKLKKSIVEFEEQWRNQLCELREKEVEVDEKIKKLHGYYLTFSEKSWKFVFGIINVTLIFSLLGAVLYTISSLPPKWAVWAPIPIAFCLFLWAYSGKYIEGVFLRKK